MEYTKQQTTVNRTNGLVFICFSLREICSFVIKNYAFKIT